MSDKEFALYLFNTMQTKRINSLTKCLNLGQKLNKELANLSDSTAGYEQARRSILMLNAEVVNSLDAELEVMTQINSVVIAFAKYIESLSDTFDKEIMISRYFYGYHWTEIKRLTGKSESTVLRRHRKCIHNYMIQNNIK